MSSLTATLTTAQTTPPSASRAEPDLQFSIECIHTYMFTLHITGSEFGTTKPCSSYPGFSVFYCTGTDTGTELFKSFIVGNDSPLFLGLKSPRLLPNRFYLPSQLLLEMLQLAHHALHNGCLVIHAFIHCPGFRSP